jgi:hypothetical protein
MLPTNEVSVYLAKWFQRRFFRNQPILVSVASKDMDFQSFLVVFSMVSDLR